MGVCSSAGTPASAAADAFNSDRIDAQMRVQERLERLDVASAKDVRAYMEHLKPNYIIHLAALTDMEYCELHPSLAHATNTGGVANVAQYAREHNLPLVYTSTAGVFDGKKDSYDETDAPNPLSVYGMSKYGGELVAKTVPKSTIVRAGWMMGGGPRKDKKFINLLMKQLAKGVTELNVVNDKLGTPTYTVDFAHNLAAMIETPYYGLYNMVCGGETGRLEVAQELVQQLKLQDRVQVKPVTSDYFAQEYFAPRPSCERLVNYKLQLRGMDLMRDWRVALHDYVRDYFSDYVKPFAPEYASDAKDSR